MLHLVRNSVAHGIERDDERYEAGKPDQGNIAVRAYHKGNHIYVEVETMDAAWTLSGSRPPGIERGFISADDAERMGRRELLDLLSPALLWKPPQKDFKLFVIEKNGHFCEYVSAIIPHLPVYVPGEHCFLAVFELREIASDVVIEGLQPTPSVPDAAIVAVREESVVGRQVVPTVDCLSLVGKKPRFDLGEQFVFLFTEAIPT